MKFECPKCAQHLEAPDDMAGEEIACPSCGCDLVIPPCEVEIGSNTPPLPSQRLRDEVSVDSASSQPDGQEHEHPTRCDNAHRKLSAVSTRTKDRCMMVIQFVIAAAAIEAAYASGKHDWVALPLGCLVGLLARLPLRPLFYNDVDKARKKIQWQLLDIANRSDDELQRLAEAIRSQNFSDIAKELPDKLESQDRATRFAAACLLAMLGDEKAIPALVNALSSMKQRRRQVAADALHKMGWEPSDTPSSVNYLLATKEFDKIPPLGSPAIPILAESMKRHKNDATVRVDLVHTLALFDAPEANDALLTASQDKSQPVRGAALKALAAIRQSLNESQLARLDEVERDHEQKRQAKRKASAPKQGRATQRSKSRDPNACEVCGAGHTYTECVAWELHLVTGVSTVGNELYAETYYQWRTLDPATTRLCKKCFDSMKGFFAPNPHEQLIRKRLTAAFPGTHDSQIKLTFRQKIQSVIKTMTVESGTIVIWRGKRTRGSAF